MNAYWVWFADTPETKGEMAWCGESPELVLAAIAASDPENPIYSPGALAIEPFTDDELDSPNILMFGETVRAHLANATEPGCIFHLNWPPAD